MPRLVLNLQYADSQNIFILYENGKHDGYSMSNEYLQAKNNYFPFVLTNKIYLS